MKETEKSTARYLILCFLKTAAITLLLCAETILLRRVDTGSHRDQTELLR